MNRILIIGYGNPDRQDDGVAWHIMRELAEKLALPAPASYEDEFPPNNRLDFAFELQLTPEMADEISTYDHVCFMDAHTGDIPENVRLVNVSCEFQRSPFTHHLTPQSLLAMCKAIYQKQPESVLLSVRGYRFQFERSLSAETELLAHEAVKKIIGWLEQFEQAPVL